MTRRNDTSEYDVVVIGAGPAGENAAGSAREHGLSAVVVEGELVGGECSYWACMPSKALLRPGEVAHETRVVQGVTGANIDRSAVLESRDRFASNWDDASQVEWLEKAEIDLVRGHGRIAGEREVLVTRRDGSSVRIAATHAVVAATGSQAAMPEIEGLASVGAWDSRAATSAKSVPQQLLVLGGGVVGVEMAQAWRRLGCEDVTIVEQQENLLPEEEPFAGSELRQALEKDGIRVLTGRQLQRVWRRADEQPLSAILDDGEELSAQELLVAVGRRANTEDIGLEDIGLEPGDFLEVDDQFRVIGVDGGWFYAVGDVNGRAPLTHLGKYQARIVGAVIAGENVSDRSRRFGPPRVVFTDPNVAAVGKTVAQAREDGLDIRVVTQDVGDTAGGSLHGKDTRGTCQLVIDRQRRVIVGATFVGPRTGEMLHAATIAVVAEVPLKTLWHAVPIFPSMSEVWLQLMQAESAE